MRPQIRKSTNLGKNLVLEFHNLPLTQFVYANLRLNLVLNSLKN